MPNLHLPCAPNLTTYLALQMIAATPNTRQMFCRRVGRTGRAGNKGTAITFIGPDEERYAPDLVKALKESSAAVPQDLQVGGTMTST